MVMGRMTEVLRNCLGVGEGGWEKQMRTGAGQNQQRCRRFGKHSRFKACQWGTGDSKLGGVSGDSGDVGD